EYVDGEHATAGVVGCPERPRGRSDDGGEGGEAVAVAHLQRDVDETGRRLGAVEVEDDLRHGEVGTDHVVGHDEEQLDDGPGSLDVGRIRVEEQHHAR